MAKEQDSMEHLKQVLREATLDLMAKNENITAHKAAERMEEHFRPLGHSHDSDELYRLFLRSFVHSIHAEQRLCQHFEKYPDERQSYMNSFKNFRSS